MKKMSSFKFVVLFAGLTFGSVASAASYDYTFHFDYVRKPDMPDDQQDAQLKIDLRACASTVGPPPGPITASYRSCMLQHGWKYLSATRTRSKPTPADRYFRADVKLAPGHFIDHNTGLDCHNVGDGMMDCTNPNGTVHYFDPNKDIPCERTGLERTCTNMFDLK